MALLLAVVSGGRSAEAAVVTQLNITAGSVMLSLGPFGPVGDSFTQNGTLIMGQYQPPPNIFPPILLHDHTFQLVTDPSLGAPPPTGTTAGTTISVNLMSLMAQLSGPDINGALDIGGLATGSFDPGTGLFHLEWSHEYPIPPVPFLVSGDFSLDGTANVAPVPLPGAVTLFATGLAGIAGLARSRGWTAGSLVQG
jgi:hypothetical protein